MRTWRTISDDKGMLTHEYVKVKDLPSTTADILAFQGLKKLTLEFEGRTITYDHIEYDCEWCGSYDHKSEMCPN